MSACPGRGGDKVELEHTLSISETHGNVQAVVEMR